MSTRCNIVVREERNPRREVILYKHFDGSPRVVIPMLLESLNKCLSTFKSTYPHWMSDSTKVAAMIVHLSVPVITEDTKKALDAAPEGVREFLERNIFIPVPAVVPDSGRSPEADYEYIVTLKEEMEDNKGHTFGFDVEVVRVSGGKRMFVVEEVSYVSGKSGFEKLRPSASSSKSGGTTP